MKSEHRHQVILAAIANPHIVSPMMDNDAIEQARQIMGFVDAIERFDDIHEMEYEQKIVENTFEILTECINAGRDRLREVLPVVMTFKAMAKTGATSSMILNLQAQFDETLKKLSGGPASVTEADAKLFHDLFGNFVGKYKVSIEEMKAALMQPIPEAPGPAPSPR